MLLFIHINVIHHVILCLTGRIVLDERNLLYDGIVVHNLTVIFVSNYFLENNLNSARKYYKTFHCLKI